MKRYIQILSLLAVFITIVVLINSFTNKNNSTLDTKSKNISANVYGNTAGNILNRGFIVKQGNWLYYSYSPLGFLSWFHSGLYKMKIDGTGKERLTSNIPSFINVVGDWVYYGYQQGLSPMGYSLYKIRIDGSGRERIGKDNFSEMVVAGDWIYYTNWSNGKLYKIRTDGTNKQKLNDDDSMSINLVSDYIYYINCIDANGSLSSVNRIKTDGTKRAKIHDDNISQMIVMGNWIYYINQSDHNKIYRMRIDGTNKEKLNNDATELINLSGDWIYYCTYTPMIRNGIQDNGDTLYKMKINGSEKIKLSSFFTTDGINIVEDGGYLIIYANDINGKGLTEVDRAKK